MRSFSFLTALEDTFKKFVNQLNKVNYDSSTQTLNGYYQWNKLCLSIKEGLSDTALRTAARRFGSHADFLSLMGIQKDFNGDNDTFIFHLLLEEHIAKKLTNVRFKGGVVSYTYEFDTYSVKVSDADREYDRLLFLDLLRSGLTFEEEMGKQFNLQELDSPFPIVVIENKHCSCEEYEFNGVCSHSKAVNFAAKNRRHCGDLISYVG